MSGNEPFSQGVWLFCLQGVKKLYGSQQVLDISELQIPAGKITAILGPNGAGKSTLLRVLSLLESYNDGLMLYNGHVISPGKTAPLHLRRQMAAVWQRPVMLDMSVYDNIAAGLRFRGIRGRELSCRIAAVAERLGMSEKLLRQHAREISGGESQKTALARALVLQPRVLFIDEPNTSLDVAAVDLIERIVEEERQKGTTIIFVTHDAKQAESLADLQLYMDRGMIGGLRCGRC